MIKHKAVYRGGSGEIIEKKSRFIANVKSVETVEEAQAYIEEMRKKYWDARHNCSAFSVGTERVITRCSDDGEPGGTAGKPILEVISGSGIHNIVVVVTRYFGGTLLGTGTPSHEEMKDCLDIIYLVCLVLYGQQLVLSYE